MNNEYSASRSSVKPLAGSRFAALSKHITRTRAWMIAALLALSALAQFADAQLAQIAINTGGGATGSFVADTGYSGGTAVTNTSATISTTGVVNPAPQAAYQSERYGNFTYTIPGLVPATPYRVRLHFAETYWTQAGQRVFNVAINGVSSLSNFDIFAAAGGANRAVVREFTVPATSGGNISIQFTSSVNNAKIDAIEVLPLTIAINAGGGASGNFMADTAYSGGTGVTNSSATINTSGVSNPAPQAAYQSERYGNFTYTISNLVPAAPYRVRLHFAETYWTQAGKRIFNVILNGVSSLANFDIFAAAGGANTAVVKEFIVPASATGTIAMQFTSVVNNAKVDAIEVIPSTTAGSGSTAGVPPTATLPSAPTNLAAVAGNGSATLSWGAVSGATGYNVKRASTSGGTYTTVASNIGTVSYVNSGLSNGTPYYYVVSALNTAGEGINSAPITVTPVAPPTISPTANLVGINLGAPLDSGTDRLYADAITTSRAFTLPNSSSAAPVDSNGWPTSDFSFYVWASLDMMNGTYALSFKGQASVVANGIGNVALSYDPTSNTSSGTIQFPTATNSTFSLTFTNTKRTGSSASGSGVTQIKMMRPVAPGSTQTHATTEMFNRAAKTLLSKFKAVRFMDYLSTNANIQTNWSDRPLPTWASFSRNPGNQYGWQGIGGPWEHIARLSNEVGTDAWINIPVRATDSYVRNVALTFAYGSDGVNPYTSPQANPVYPPLDPARNLYVEYSNELWNSASAFTQFKDNCKAASDELVATSGNSPLNYDKRWNGATWGASNWDWVMCSRRTAKRSAEISNIFRSVFGDAAMGTRIRPVLLSQLGYATGPLFIEADMMFSYYNNGAGNFVSTPHPPSYYFYGGGGSGYYSPSNSVSTLDAFFADPGMNPAGSIPAFKADMGIIAALGLKRIAYEGGPDLGKLGGARDAISPLAVQDPRMTTAIVNIHNAWSANGGDLFVYHTATGDFQWGFTPSPYNLATPKLKAVDALNASQRAALTFGTPIPGSVPGNAPDICSRAYSCNQSNFTSSGSGNVIWASYAFRSPTTAQHSVTLSFSSASYAQVALYVDGVLIGTQGTSGAGLIFNAGTLGAGVHGVIVKAVSGSFSLSSVAVQ